MLDNPSQFAFGWFVEDWRTGIPLVRHRVQELSYEKVISYFELHDGHDVVKEVIIDSEYNAKFEI